MPMIRSSLSALALVALALAPVPAQAGFGRLGTGKMPVPKPLKSGSTMVGAGDPVTACHPGRDPHAPGATGYIGGLSSVGGALTPEKLPGATTISAAEGKCLIDQYGARMLVIAAIDDANLLLPGAVVMKWAAADDWSLQQRFYDQMDQLTGGDKDRPMLVYCHHESCFLSYNVALRAVMAGYTHVYWMRPGASGWRNAGYAFGASGTAGSPSERSQ